MRQGWRLAGSALCAFALVGCTGMASAQSLRGVRIDLHPVKFQIGTVTRVIEKTAWVKLPQRVAVGREVEFLPFSDGADVLAKGRVQWVTPTAPYEAYVTGIEATVTQHRISDTEDTFSIGAVSNTRRSFGARSESEGFASFLAAGFFARALPEPPRENAESVHPVAAYIAALRTRGNRTANAIATAAASVMKAGANAADSETPVDYSALSDKLQRFRALRIEDPITEKLLKRLFSLIEYYGTISEKVAPDFLRSADEAPAGGIGGQVGTRR